MGRMFEGIKPGGHLLAFGGTRTYHRMACAIEDAGFEIRDQMQWIYGSGFPKSHDISKAIDKKLGAERKVLGVSPNWRESKRDREKDGKMEVRGKNAGLITKPATLKAKQWEGWGTCLKPANEPIVLARKPISEKTIADNVLKWGTGGINIDGCRIPTEDDLGRLNKSSATWGTYGNGASSQYGKPVEEQGRFPANVILDEEAGRMLDQQSGSVSYGNKSGGYSYSDRQYAVQGFVKDCKPKAPSNYGDSGGASRFFYCAKASKKERGEGNNHPTVKPLSLIKYLITLVTPPGGICLDPFEGSGTHALACKD
jgi:hypothetical protein